MKEILNPIVPAHVSPPLSVDGHSECKNRSSKVLHFVALDQIARVHLNSQLRIGITKCQAPVLELVRGPSHAAPVLTTHLKEGVGDLAKRTHPHRVHQDFKHITVVHHRLL